TSSRSASLQRRCAPRSMVVVVGPVVVVVVRRVVVVIELSVAGTDEGASGGSDPAAPAAPIPAPKIASVTDARRRLTASGEIIWLLGRPEPGSDTDSPASCRDGSRSGGAERSCGRSLSSRRWRGRLPPPLDRPPSS